jgi:GAF domain-containing protein
LWAEVDHEVLAAKPLIQSISIHGEPIGRLAVLPEDNEDEIDLETAEIVRSVVEQLEARIENLRLADQTEVALAETEEQAQRLGRLNEMSAALNRAKSLADVYTIAVAEASKVLAVDWAGLTLLNDSLDSFEIVAIWGEDFNRPLDVVLTIAEPSMRLAVQENRIVRGAIEGVMNSALFVPLVVGNKVIGTLNAGYKETKKYKASDENLLRQAAALVSSNIENMRFLANEQARAQREQMLRQISQRIRSSADVETIMRTAVQEIGRTLGRKTYIYLGDDHES